MRHEVDAAAVEGGGVSNGGVVIGVVIGVVLWSAVLAPLAPAA